MKLSFIDLDIFLKSSTQLRLRFYHLNFFNLYNVFLFLIISSYKLTISLNI